MVFDISSLPVNKQEKITKGTKDYLHIQGLYNSLSSLNDKSDKRCVDFQKAFNSFYKLIRHKESWYNDFYNTFDEEKKRKNTGFSNVYNDLSKKTGRDEKSFSSKMYHTMNNTSPIIDKNVLKGLKIPGRSKKGNGLAIYGSLWDEYYKTGGLIDCAKRDELSKQFDDLCIKYGMQNTSLNTISLVKKIDFYLWAYFA